MVVRYRSIYDSESDTITWNIATFNELFYRPNFKVKLRERADVKIGDYMVVDEDNWFRVTEVKDDAYNRLLPHLVVLGEKDGDRPFSHYAPD